MTADGLSQAIGYINNHWAALQVHVPNAHVPNDNNLTEQLMKQVAIDRRNWLSSGIAGWRGWTEIPDAAAVRLPI